ncbi:MAG: disulfide bond formation protein B [Chlamydiales bacterium]|nr:disulfide bond formation protein B [Chlamydiales bacterium]
MILALSLSLAGYHLLVIGRLISDPCAVPHAPQTLAEFQSMLNAPLPCATASWRLLGIPISAYNLVLSTGMLLLLLAKGFRRA